jgi:hypothetical protein
MSRNWAIILLSLAMAGAGSTAAAQSLKEGRGRDAVSPFLQIEPPVRERDRSRADPGPADMRSIDGSRNHQSDIEHNATHNALARVVPAAYADGIATLAGADRLSAREISNRVNDQTQLVENPFGTSHYLWQWGQFVDHDIDLTGGTDPPESAHVPVAAGDPDFDPDSTGIALIPFNRSAYAPATGTDTTNPRQQTNQITAWIDASNVYGSDPERAAALRSNDGTGRLATNPGDLLPNSGGTLSNATGGSSQPMFLAGDVRANEQIGLTVLHTLFVREHNRLAGEIGRGNPKLDGDAIYQRARLQVGALMQVITYEEFLPALLGPGALPPYRGYDEGVDARIANEFSTAAYRFGHSALSPWLQRLDRNLNEVPEGHVALRDAFFSPDRLRDEGGIDPILRGLAHQKHQRIDLFVIDDVRNFLFGPPGAGGFDLAALNIQRGRDHGLGSYNEARVAYGLAPALGFADISRDPEVQLRLANAYSSVDAIDLWIGCLAEDPSPGSQVGPLAHEILVEQFSALRDGDRFWYEHALELPDLERARRTRLADVIRRNTGIGNEIPDDVFRVVAKEEPQRARDRRGGARGGRR